MFTPEELAEMAAADAEIEADFEITSDELFFSDSLDKIALREKGGKPAVQRRRTASNTPVFPPFFGHLFGGLPVVAGLAKALVVGRVNEQRPVPTVGPDVVHHRGPGTDAPPGALPTPWLPQELGRAQVVGPDGQAIPAVPLGGDPPGRFAGLMLGAVPLPGEGRASGMAARPERL